MKKQRLTGAHCLGTYPKWFARCVRWMIQRNASATVEVSFKGRGRMKGRAVKTSDGRRIPFSRYYRYGLPVSLSHRVAIYITVKKNISYERFKQASDNTERMYLATPRFEEATTK